MRRKHTMLGMLAALMLLTVACSTSGQPPDTEPDDGEAAALAYSRCMREHGFDWPDPVLVDGRWDNPVPEGIDPELPAFQDAQTECEAVAWAARGDVGDPNPEDRALMEEEMERMLMFSHCMRDQGIDFPDPEFEEDGISGPAGPLDGDWDAFNKARTVCEEETGAPMP